MKKLLILILALLLCTSCLFACQNASNSETESEGGATNNGSNTSRLPAQDTTGEGFELALAEDKLSYIFVSMGTCGDERVVIPATYKELPVSAIASGAFSGSSKITEIVISEGITSIESEAFSYSKGLKKVTVANSVKSIGDKAFFNCDGLSSVKLGEGLSEIAIQAFCGCVNLKDIRLPASLEKIGENAFEDCISLVFVVMHDKTKISNSSFIGCDSLVTVYYYGTEEAFEGVFASEEDKYGNDAISGAKLYFYSEQKPEASGDFWYMDEKGRIKLWK